MHRYDEEKFDADHFWGLKGYTFLLVLWEYLVMI